MSNRTTTLLLQARVDQDMAAQGVRALQQIQAASDNIRRTMLALDTEVANTSDVFMRLGRVSEVIGRDRDIDALAQQFVALGRAANDSDTALMNLRQAMRQIGASSDEIDKATRAFQAYNNAAQGGGTGRASATSARSFLTGAASLVGGPTGEILRTAEDLGQVTEGFKALSKDGIGPLLTTLGPMGVAAAGLTAVFKELEWANNIYKDIVDETKSKLDAEAATRKELNNLIETATTAEALAYKTSLQRQIADEQANLAAAKLAQSTANVGQGFLGSSAKFDAATQKIEETNTKLAGLQEKLDGVNQVLAQGALGGDDKALQTRVKNERLQYLNDEAAFEEKRLQLLRTGTVKGLTEEITSMGEWQFANQKLLDQLSRMKDPTEEVKAEIVRLSAELQTNKRHQADLIDLLINVVQKREDEAAAIQAQKDALAEAGKAWNSLTKDLTNFRQVGEEISKLESDRASQLKQQAEDEARSASRTAIEKDYAARIATAKQADEIQKVKDEAAKADVTATIKAEASRAKLDQTFFDTSLKAYQSYIEDEQNLQANANKQRLRTLEAAQWDLRRLAAQGDVAAFVERQYQAQTDLKNQAEDADEAAQKRQAQYDRELQAAEQAHMRQLDDLNQTLEQERATRQQAADQQIKDLEAQGQVNNSRTAQLEEELNSIREQWRQEDLQRQRDQEAAAFEDRLQLQRDKQAEILAETGDYFDQWLAQIQQAFTGNSNFFSWIQGVVGGLGNAFGFADGLDYVPKDNFPAILHEGEKVLTRQEATDYRSGQRGGGDTYQISISNHVGDLATKSMLDDYQDTLIAGVGAALEQTRGVGVYD